MQVHQAEAQQDAWEQQRVAKREQLQAGQVSAALKLQQQLHLLYQCIEILNGQLEKSSATLAAAQQEEARETAGSQLGGLPIFDAKCGLDVWHAEKLCIILHAHIISEMSALHCSFGHTGSSILTEKPRTHGRASIRCCSNALLSQTQASNNWVAAAKLNSNPHWCLKMCLAAVGQIHSKRRWLACNPSGRGSSNCSQRTGSSWVRRLPDWRWTPISACKRTIC